MIDSEGAVRLHTIVPALSLLAGCSSTYVPVEQLVDECTPRPLFLDSDGDGWGSSAPAESTLACSSDEQAQSEGFTAFNNRDCDDTDTTITGLTGSLCPGEVLPNLPREAYTAFSVDSIEYLVVEPTADTVWPEYGADVCGSTGWGGAPPVDASQPFGAIDENATGLAVPSAGALSNIVDQIEPLEYWAGWLGVVGEGGEWVNERTGTSFDPASLGLIFCDGDEAVPTDAALQRLALIKRTLLNTSHKRTAEICVGSPAVVYGLWSPVRSSNDEDYDDDGVSSNTTVQIPGAEVYSNGVFYCNTDGDDTATQDECADLDASSADDVKYTLDRSDTLTADELADWDGDGVDDGREVLLLGTDPTVADDFPEYDDTFAHFACERPTPDAARWALSDLPGSEE